MSWWLQIQVINSFETPTKSPRRKVHLKSTKRGRVWGNLNKSNKKAIKAEINWIANNSQIIRQMNYECQLAKILFSLLSTWIWTFQRRVPALHSHTCNKNYIYICDAFMAVNLTCCLAKFAADSSPCGTFTCTHTHIQIFITGYVRNRESRLGEGMCDNNCKAQLRALVLFIHLNIHPTKILC